MPGARSLKYRVQELLRSHDPESAMTALRPHSPRQVINALIAQFYAADPLIRWRAVASAGFIVRALAESDRESARVIMRRFMWMLNDESGGIGWGAPEAMGEIMAQSGEMAAEYGRILISYIKPEQNFLEHPGLQRGVLWGLGRLAQKRPRLVSNVLPEFRSFLTSADAYHRGYAAWAVGNIGDRDAIKAVAALTADNHEIHIFDEGRLQALTVGELAGQAISKTKNAEEKD